MIHLDLTSHLKDKVKLLTASVLFDLFVDRENQLNSRKKFSSVLARIRLDRMDCRIKD